MPPSTSLVEAAARSVTEGLPGTTEETADLVDRRGGHGIAVRCDHTNDTETRGLFERVEVEQGRLDLLVNNAWGGYEHYDHLTFRAPLWNQPLTRWDQMFTAGVRVHIVASRMAAPLLIRTGGGLVVGTTVYEDGAYLGNLYYDLAKHAVCRLAAALAEELRDHGVAVVAVAPGFVGTERVLAAGVAPTETESPEYTGRAVRALAADPSIMGSSGSTLLVSELAKRYGFHDLGHSA